MEQVPPAWLENTGTVSAQYRRAPTITSSPSTRPEQTPPDTTGWNEADLWRSAKVCAIAVIIPCYNEVATIGTVVKEFRQALPTAEIYVYDNNSTDNSASVARDAGAIVRAERRKGKGHVVRRMFRDVEADLYILSDGGGTYDASAAPAMVRLAIEGPYDLVNGCRVPVAGKRAYRPGHRIGNLILTGLVLWLFGNRAADVLSGYKVLSRRLVKSFPVFSAGFEIETELTVHALEIAAPMTDVETRYGERPAGSKSKLHTVRDGLHILRLIVQLVVHERPMLFFSAIAASFALLSVGLAVPVLVDYVQTGLVYRLPTTVLSTGLMMFAIFSLGCGIVLSMVARGRREAKLLSYLTLPSPVPVTQRGLWSPQD
jgi:hypothetical protein